MTKQEYDFYNALHGIRLMSWAALHRDIKREVVDNPIPNVVNFIVNRLIENDMESLSILSAALSPVNAG